MQKEACRPCRSMYITRAIYMQEIQVITLEQKTNDNFRDKGGFEWYLVKSK